MKKTFVCAVVLAGCVLTACGNEEKVITGEVANITTESTETAAESTENTEQETETAKAGYVFEAKGTEVVIDAKAQEILESLGEANSVYESPSCAFGDLDRIYTYDGFEIDTYTLDDVEYISAVCLRDDTVTTTEGAGIGNTVEEVQEIYGQPDTAEDTILTYAKEQMKLCFLLQDGKVVSVEYRNTILD